MKKNISETIIERFNSEAGIGLNAQQVKTRINQNLTNCVNQKYSKSYLNIFVNNVCTFFNLLGLIVFIALLCVHAPVANFVFALVYVANMTIGIVQEIRAKRCIDRLSIVALKDVTVIREGEKTDIPVREIVLDEVLVLGIGSQVPTDCVVLDGFCEVNEALLTGESDPVKKKKGEYMLAGSFIISGNCTVRAIKVGKDNYVEKLTAKAKKYKKPHSELMNSLKLIIKIIGFAIVPIATLFFTKSFFWVEAGLRDSIMRTSTLVIGMIPSGMFLLTSLALAVGIIKLAKHNTLVQDLYSLEMLARVDTICFDKTGTITDGNMTVSSVDKLCDSNDLPDLNVIMSNMIGVLNDNNQTAVALYNYFGQNNELVSIYQLPFNSTRKLSAVTFEKYGTFSFGAPEFVLSKEKYAEIENIINDKAKQGYRVLVVAHSNDGIENDCVPSDLSPIALINIVDNVREDAIKTIKWFKENDVAVKVISGDNPITVAEVSKRVGIENADNYVNLEGLSDQEVFDCANKYTVFGRVTPEQKAILIRALKAEGHVTAMTGDGVNDILALKEADCAISVASGSDAAKNISHLVLLDNNFNSMPQVVFEGRRVINNIQSSASLYLMKTLFTMIMAIVTFCLPYMKVYPFTLSQMNLLEILIIGIPSFFLSFQANDKRIQGKFINYVISKSLPSALMMFLSVAIFEIVKKCIGSNNDRLFSTLQIFALTYAGVINLFMICKPFNKFRTILFSLILSTLVLITVYTCIFGLNVIDLYAITPFETYNYMLFILLGVILIDIVIAKPISDLCSKIKLPIKV